MEAAAAAAAAGGSVSSAGHRGGPRTISCHATAHAKQRRVQGEKKGDPFELRVCLAQKVKQNFWGAGGGRLKLRLIRGFQVTFLAMDPQKWSRTRVSN